MSPVTTELVELAELDALPSQTETLPQPCSSPGRQTSETSNVDEPSDPGPICTRPQDETSSAEAQDQRPAVQRPLNARSRCCTIISSTATGNVLVIPGLLIAILGFAWMLLSQRWTMCTAQLQDCLSFRQVDIYSDVCNATIESGLPSFWRKRDLDQTSVSILFQQEAFWSKLALGLVLTVAAIIYSTIWFRPRIAVFLPVVSLVRTIPTITTIYQGCVRYSATNVAQNLVRTITGKPTSTIEGASELKSRWTTQGIGAYLQRQNSTKILSDPTWLGEPQQEGSSRFQEVRDYTFDEITQQQLKGWSRSSSARSSLDLGEFPEPMPMVRFGIDEPQVIESMPGRQPRHEEILDQQKTASTHEDEYSSVVYERHPLVRKNNFYPSGDYGTPLIKNVYDSTRRQRREGVEADFRPGEAPVRYNHERKPQRADEITAREEAASPTRSADRKHEQEEILESVEASANYDLKGTTERWGSYDAQAEVGHTIERAPRGSLRTWLRNRTRNRQGSKTI